ncbi:hypothetical protein [Actinacidiphila sp. bgisy160]|uniref:hypothetical protein n=1 Tax=Actinacidiphila sp. bgisy160 TaxID=3413796 RepID=UPI003D752508
MSCDPGFRGYHPDVLLTAVGAGTAGRAHTGTGQWPKGDPDARARAAHAALDALLTGNACLADPDTVVVVYGAPDGVRDGRPVVAAAAAARCCSCT